MSEHQMTGREFAALSFRILGVFIFLSGLAQGLMMLPSLARGGWSGWGIAWISALLLSVVFAGMVALPLIFRAESLVRWLFPESDRTIAFAVSERQILACGLALLGAWFLAGHLPYVARLVAEIIWQAEGGRRAELDPSFFSSAAFDILGGLFTCAVGWVLFRFAGRITGWWAARGSAG